VAGFVPSIKPDGAIRLGTEQMKAAEVVQAREEKMAKEKVRRVLLLLLLLLPSPLPLPSPSNPHLLPTTTTTTTTTTIIIG